MKKILFPLLCVLLVTGCNLFPSAEETCDISVVCDSNGTVNPSQLSVVKGDPAQLVISPFVGCVIKSITIKGKSVSVPSNNILDIYDTFYDELAVVIEIVKVKEYYTVFASANIGGKITPSGEITVEKGKSQIFDFVSDNNNWIDSVYVDGIGKKAPEFTTVSFYSFYAEDTLHHSFRVVFRPRKIFTITTSVDSLGTITPLGVIYVTEGGNLTINTKPDELCSLTGLYIDSVKVSGSSYTFTGIKAKHKAFATFVKEPEWYLCKIVWRKIYLNIGGVEYVPDNEIFYFYINGKYKRISSSGTYNDIWKLNKTVKPMIINFGYGDCSIDVLSDNYMLVHYTDQYGGKIYMGYENIGYKQP